MKTRQPGVLLLAVTLLLDGRRAGAEPMAGSTTALSPAASAVVNGNAGGGATWFDAVWRAADLYHDENAPVVQHVRFTGRFQLDYARVPEGDFEDWHVRRLRLGLAAACLHQWSAHVEVDLQPQEQEVYQRLTEAHVAWSPNPDLTFKLGKHSASFTLDGSTPSRELLTLERNNLANNLWFPQEYFPGVSVSGRRRDWRWTLGAYSAGSNSREFGRFNGGVFALATIGCDLAARLNVQKAALTLNYVCQERDRDNSFTRPLANVASLNFTLEHGRWGLRGDLSG
ncbi:MAG: porin, partial [Verrucomicrobiales bacterium]|nr:porin [Verrucomicrobiales bacterium]